MNTNEKKNMRQEIQKSSLGYCTIEIVEIDLPFPKRHKCPEQSVIVQIIFKQMQPMLIRGI